MSEPHKLSVFITRRNGHLTFDRSKGFAPCMIWADVKPLASDLPDFPSITAIYMESDFDNAIETLPENCNDALYTDACKLLETDQGWYDWAQDELAAQREMHAVDAAH